jgi:NTP pyrophosphatase (non-canonical NTP hydrolase)
MDGDSSAYRLEDLQRELREFRDERDWAQFHDPKSVILALVGEVGELAELFQWVPADQAAAKFSQGQPHHRAGEEMSDVLIYLLGIGGREPCPREVLGRSLLKCTTQRLKRIMWS